MPLALPLNALLEFQVSVEKKQPNGKIPFALVSVSLNRLPHELKIWLRFYLKMRAIVFIGLYAIGALLVIYGILTLNFARRALEYKYIQVLR